MKKLILAVGRCGSVGGTLVSLTDCRWWFDSPHASCNQKMHLYTWTTRLLISFSTRLPCLHRQHLWTTNWSRPSAGVYLLYGLFFPSNAFMASARSFNTFNCMLQIMLQGLISAYTWPSADWEASKVNWYRTWVQSSRPSRSHHQTKQNTNQKQTHQHKTKHNNTKQNRRTKVWQVPVHGLIHARDDNIVSSRYGMAAETERRTSKKNQAIPEGEWSNKGTMRKPGIPPARIPEITWRKPIRHTVGRHRLGPEHVQNSTPETWSHPNTMRASGARALGGMFCNARVTHTAKLCTKDTGAKKQVLGQKSLCWTRKSHIGTLLPGDVNLHYRRQIEVDA